MGLGDLAPDIAKLLHIQPSTLVLLILILNVAARGIARRIPNDATGFWGFIRQSAAILGVEVSTRVTSDATAADILKAAASTPPIPQKVEANKDHA